MPVIPLPLRIVAFSWGLVETFGFFFTTEGTVAPALIVYTVLPPVALITGSAMPDKWATRVSVKWALVGLLAAGIVRRVHSVGGELLDSPPYWLAAGLQAISLAILVLLALRLLKPAPG